MPLIHNRRIGNSLPAMTDSNKELVGGRESMLYSYQNTVSTSYVGDIRHYVMKFGDYLRTKNSYWDPVKNLFIEFPIRYAAPNLAFSDDKGVQDAASEASIKDRVVLPLISYYLTGMEHDPKRAVDPSVRYNYKPKNSAKDSRAYSTTAPKPIKYTFNVDVWTETRESFYQIITAIQLDFNPYSYLTDLFDFEDETEKTTYIPYVKMNLDSFSDGSNYVPGTNRRMVRGTLKISVEGWLTQPPKDTPYVLSTKITTGFNETIQSSNTVTKITNEVDINLPLNINEPPVTSVYGRVGDVTALTGDYNSDKVTVDEGLAGIVAPGETLQTSLEAMTNKMIKDAFQIMLSENMSIGTPFRIINNKAYRVKSIDAITPSVDGIILIAGSANSVTTAGRKTNTEYDLGISFTQDQYLYLSQTGMLTSTVPNFDNGDVYSLIVGRSIAGTTSFVLNPQPPIKLA